MAEALLEIDGSIAKTVTAVSDEEKDNDSSDGRNNFSEWEECEEDIVYSLAEVREIDTEEILIDEADRRICADYVNLYPPGIPLLLPGERITKEHIALINRYLEKDMHVQGVSERRILVCRDFGREERK